TYVPVAGKTRHRSKKTSAETRRPKKPSVVRRAPRAAARRGAGVAKPPVRRKADGEGAAPVMTIKKATQRQGFKTNEFIVHPAHGVGQIMSIEEQEVAGAKLELFVINFVKDKITLRVRTAKIASVGFTKLAKGALASSS